MAMCLSVPHSAMILCHSAIEQPYFFSIDGKYDAGPCFGQGADCSTTFSLSFDVVADESTRWCNRSQVARHSILLRQLNIHRTPYRSAHVPQYAPHGMSARPNMSLPPSERRPNSRSISPR